MIGYYDCPPHPCETLNPELDAKWVRIVDKSVEALEEALRVPSAVPFEHYYLGGVILNRYK
jgi:hypothetical protein